jgi:pyridoxamine 5'-phosphate oxidase
VGVDGAFGSDPVAWFRASFARAQQSETFDPCRAALASVDGAGMPHVRFVLVRRVDERGFAFFTNLRSEKAQQLSESPRAALAFHWASISEQVRIEGVVEAVSAAEADDYFATRPRASQLSAWASRQSQPIESRAVLDDAYAKIDARFADVAVIPRPAFWGGYRVVPTRIEFWLGHDARLHDRWSFARVGETWRMTRLQP